MVFNIKEMMEKAKEMQHHMQKTQEQLKQITVIGSAGGGLVKIHSNGLHQVLRVEISKELFDEKDQELMEDLVAAAYNDTSKKIEEMIKQKMGEIAKDIKLPEDSDINE